MKILNTRKMCQFCNLTILTKLTLNTDNNVCFSLCTSLNVAKQKDMGPAFFKLIFLLTQRSILNNFQEPTKSFSSFLLVVLFTNILRTRMG